jgi:hypothetical protein
VATPISAALDVLCWGPHALARASGYNERTCRRWIAGELDPPDDVVIWITDLARLHLARPPPPKPLRLVGD